LSYDPVETCFFVVGTKKQIAQAIIRQLLFDFDRMKI